MQLCAAFLVAFGPVLGLTLDPIQPMVNHQSQITKKCLKTPMMPQTFFAERRFASFLNTIVFSDHRGREFGYVKSWFMDWQNPFGYAGASFYMRVPDEDPADVGGVWTMDPDRATMSFEKSQEIGAMPETSAMTAAEAEVWEKKMNWDYRHGVGAKYNGYWHVGSMHGVHDASSLLINTSWAKIAAGHPQVDQMDILDCHGKLTTQAQNGELTSHSYEDATYYVDQTGPANQLIFQDLSIPKQGVAELIMKAPCQPFPPFCAGMGMSGWFLYGSKWEGRITQQGYNVTTGISGLKEIVGAGAAADMTFLTLYSSYQYSNTRWSPLMFILMNALLPLLCLCCCIRHCFCTTASYTARKVAPEEKGWHQVDEETQKLMTTKEWAEEWDHGGWDPKPTSTGLWGSCCRRPGGSTIAKMETKHEGSLISPTKTGGH